MEGPQRPGDAAGAALKDFQESFFVMRRVAALDWAFVEKQVRSSGSSAFVSDILRQTCLHPLCRKFPPSVRYRRLFLSELIRQLEGAGHDPLDELYDALAEVVGAAETSECYKSYLLPDGGAVSLLESVALISDGTTGLVTWEAAQYLAEWALDHRELFSGRTVLELGSGVGLTGVAICRSCGPKRFVFSDCHPAVLHKLQDNLRLNGLAARGSPAASVKELDWMAATEAELREIGADVVIAADVVYDPDVVGALVRLLSQILRTPPAAPDVFVCSTVRNAQTYGGFRRQLEEAGLAVQELPGPVRRVFPYNRLSDIQLIRLRAGAAAAQ